MRGNVSLASVSSAIATFRKVSWQKLLCSNLLKLLRSGAAREQTHRRHSARRWKMEGNYPTAPDNSRVRAEVLEREPRLPCDSWLRPRSGDGTFFYGDDAQRSGDALGMLFPLARDHSQFEVVTCARSIRPSFAPSFIAARASCGVSATIIGRSVRRASNSSG